MRYYKSDTKLTEEQIHIFVDHQVIRQQINPKTNVKRYYFTNYGLREIIDLHFWPINLSKQYRKCQYFDENGDKVITFVKRGHRHLNIFIENGIIYSAWTNPGSAIAETIANRSIDYVKKEEEEYEDSKSLFLGICVDDYLRVYSVEEKNGQIIRKLSYLMFENVCAYNEYYPAYIKIGKNAFKNEYKKELEFDNAKILILNDNVVESFIKAEKIIIYKAGNYTYIEIQGDDIWFSDGFLYYKKMNHKIREMGVIEPNMKKYEEEYKATIQDYWDSLKQEAIIDTWEEYIDDQE